MHASEDAAATGLARGQRKTAHRMDIVNRTQCVVGSGAEQAGQSDAYQDGQQSIVPPSPRRSQPKRKGSAWPLPRVPSPPRSGHDQQHG